MSVLVLFGIGSPLVVDYEETCRRQGIRIVAGVQNYAGPVFVTSSVTVRSVDGLDDELKKVPCICPLFTPSNRRLASSEAQALGFSFLPSLIDPTSIIADSTSIGSGCYFNAACVVGGCGVIGSQVVVNRGASIGHHARIADFVSIGPSAVLAGEVTVETGALVGAGAVILPQVRIGKFAVVGAGSVVTRDVPDRHRVAGNPAETIGTDCATFQ